jgi:hypothetical protein
MNNINRIYVLALFILVLISGSLHAEKPWFVDGAALYLPFEGTDNGLGSLCWQNWGAAGYGEHASQVGIGPYPTVTVTGDDGIKGQSFDSRHIANKTAGNTYVWGYYGTEGDGSGGADSALEKGLKDVWSFTITGWVKPMPLGDISRLIKVHNVFDLMAWSNGELQLMLAETEHWLLSGTAGILLQSNQWNFFAATYDGTDSFANVKMYIGTETTPVQITSRLHTKAIGFLDGGTNGGRVAIGNYSEVAERPITGLLDEVRIWVSHDENPFGVLTLEELEQVRQWDLQVIATCADVQNAGLGLAEDFNGDCQVNFLDLSMLCANWLTCNNPQDDLCQ